MKLIVGLGNPGHEYARTRHNVGFMVVDRLAERFAPGAVARQRFQSLTIEATLPERSPRDWDDEARRWSSEAFAVNRVLLMKPMTYMNLSGRAVAEAVRFYKLDPSSDVLVIVDEVALPVGALRLRAAGSAGGHNGLASIEQMLGTDRYPRCRFGIDPSGRIPQRDYVLGRFTDEQLPAVERGIERAAAGVELWASVGVVEAGNVFNVKKQPKPRKPKGPGPSERAMLARRDVAQRAGGDAGESSPADPDDVSDSPSPQRSDDHSPESSGASGSASRSSVPAWAASPSHPSNLPACPPAGSFTPAPTNHHMGIARGVPRAV